MNIEEQNPLQHKLKQELENSQWLQKFKQLSEGLRKIKEEIPLTQLCELQWVTENHSLILNCPNLEVREGLLQQSGKISQLNMGAKRFIIRYSQGEDIIIHPQSSHK